MRRPIGLWLLVALLLLGTGQALAQGPAPTLPALEPSATPLPLAPTPAPPSPAPVPTSLPPAGEGSSQAQTLGSLVASAVALIVALIGWGSEHRRFSRTLRLQEQQLAEQQARFGDELAQKESQFRRELEQRQAQVQKDMELKWAQFREEYTPPEQRLKEWLDDLDLPEVRSLGTGNPYVVGPPIRDPRNLYGRQELANDFYELVLGEQATSLALLGARRAGKTSFLSYVSHPDVVRAQLAERGYGPSSVHLVYLNLQGGIATPADFFGRLVRATARALQRQDQDLAAALALPRRVRYSYVEDLVREVCDRGYRLVFLLDEFEKLVSDPSFDLAFLENLRALATGPEVAWVTTSFRDLYGLARQKGLQPTSPFFNIFSSELHVGAISEEEARRLIREPAARANAPFQEEDVEFILQRAGRLPHPLQTASFFLFRARRGGKRGEEARKEADAAFVRAMSRYYGHYWRNLTGAEESALRRLAGGSPLTASDREALGELARYGFVDDAGGDYALPSTAFQDWIRQQPLTPGSHAAQRRPRARPSAR